MHNAYLCGGPVDKDSAACLLLFASHNRQGGQRLLWEPFYRLRQQRRMAQKLARLTPEAVHAACNEYVATCMRGASRWRKGGEKFCAVPYQWHMVARLGDAAWDMAYAVARCKCDALAEQRGDDSILSEAAQEMEDNWPEYMKDIAKAVEPEKVTAS
jgi:hypothetical protein